MRRGQEHIVIIGGGFGGINVAYKLKKANARVTLIDKNNHHLFQPLLYQVATAALAPSDIAIPIRGLLGKEKGFKILLAKADEIDAANDTVWLTDGRSIPYDRLVIAPGSRYNYFGNEQWSDHAPGLKSIADSLDIRERILYSLEKADQIDEPEKRKPYLTFVVIGGGPTGVETAGAIAEIVKQNIMDDYSSLNKDETRIFLLEATDGILGGYPDSLSGKARQTLENMGVEVMLNTPVNSVEPGKVMLEEGSIETRNMIWAAGVVASPLTNSLDAEHDKTNRVKVTDRLTLPNHPDIFVIGDAAHLQQDGSPLPALAPVAIQQGKYVGKMLARGDDPSEAKPFHYVDKGTMTTIGRAKAVVNIRGFKFTGFFAWLLWAIVHIYFLIGFRNRVSVFSEWVWHYITFNRGVRLITSRFKEEVSEGVDKDEDQK